MTDDKPVYTVTEIQPDGRRYFTSTISSTAGAVDFSIRQGLRWWKIPEDTPLRRRPDKYEKTNVVIVTPDIAALPEWTGPVPQWEIRKHSMVFTMNDTSGTDPMRVDEGWEPKAE
jgi:hypothetical protein